MNSDGAEVKQIAAVDGWFTMPPTEPHLIGSKCQACGDYFFPKTRACVNPRCMSSDIEEVLLSRKGRLFTYAVNYYEPPPPYRSLGPFVPYATAVIELEKEKMKIGGQIVSGYDLAKLRIGMEVETVVVTLHIDDQGNEVLAWKFRPTGQPE